MLVALNGRLLGVSVCLVGLSLQSKEISQMCVCACKFGYGCSHFFFLMRTRYQTTLLQKEGVSVSLLNTYPLILEFFAQIKFKILRY